MTIPAYITLGLVCSLFGALGFASLGRQVVWRQIPPRDHPTSTQIVPPGGADPAPPYHIVSHIE
eukprot:7879234-Pyramimonas_sp.AAC.2